MVDTIVSRDYAIVQTCATLAVLDADWTSRPELIPMRGTEGVGQFVGSMEIELRAGRRTLPGAANAMATQAISSYLGQFVRVLYHNQATGTITIAGLKYDPLWYGNVVSQITAPDGATAIPGGLQHFHCVGISAQLDGVFINQGVSYGWQNGVSTGPWDPGYCPLFNAMPTKNNNTFGERSSATVSLTGTSPLRSVYVFDLVTPTDTWTAFEVVDHLLANFAQVSLPPTFSYVGPSWTISDPLGCLGYTPDKLDFHGKPLLECINALINPRRGCTWRASVAAGVVTLTVYSTSAAAVTSGSFTFPASTTAYALDSRGNQMISGLQITEDINNRFDYIQVEGMQPLAAISLYFKTDDSGSLIKGWDSSLEATWDPSLNQGPTYGNVWRRYLLQDSWNGSQYKNSATIGLRAKRTSSSSGYDGARTFAITASDFTAPAKLLKLDKFIPLPSNQDYSTTPAAGSLDMTAPLLAPMLFLKDGSDYTDITDDYSISIEENPAAVVIDGDMEALAAMLTSTAELVVTIGIRESHPLMVAWKSGSLVGQIPKVMVRRIPYCEQWVALDGTVMGVNAGTAFYTLSSTLTVVDDLEKLEAWLAVLQTWYGVNAVTATWTDRSQIDYAVGNGTCQPGSLVTSVHRGDSALDCNAVITTRAWDFTDDNFGTSYTTERVVPDIASIESHPRINQIFRSNAERDSLA